MGSKNVRHSDGALYSPRQVLDAAHAYYALSAVLTDRLPDDLDEVNKMPVQLDVLAASATNRILALELYFKALLVAEGRPIPWDHDLIVLFEANSQAVRDSLEVCFEEKCADISPSTALALVGAFQLGNEIQDEAVSQAYAKRPAGKSLVAMLERNRRGFAISRYLFENAVHNKPSLFVYEYRHLGIVCDLMRSMMELAIPEGN
jgi:hypothetical protein